MGCFWDPFSLKCMRIAGLSPYFSSQIVEVVLRSAEGRRSSPRIKLMTLLFPALVSPIKEARYNNNETVRIANYLSLCNVCSNEGAAKFTRRTIIKSRPDLG